MRRRISLLVAATTSAVILAFVIPLCVLVRSMAQDHALASADQEARGVALLVSSLGDNDRLSGLVTAVNERSRSRTSVLLPDGQVLGAPDSDMASDPMVLHARSETAAFTRVDGSGGHVLVPIATGDGGVTVVRTTVATAVLRAGVTRAWLAIGSLGILMLVAAVVTADLIGRRISTPVTRVAEVADRIREGDLGAHAEPTGPHETVALAEALNRLSSRTVELLAAERAAVGDLSHRLRTPVTALRLDVESVADPVVAERLRSHVGRLQRTVDAIVKDARRPVRTDATAACDVVEVVGERLSFWTPLAHEQGRRLVRHLPTGPLRVLAHADDLRDVVDILVDNVFAHTPDGVGIAVSLTPDDRHVVLEVADDGPGFDPAGGRTEREGTTGLGLELARRTVLGSGGQLDVETGPGGTRVTVTMRREA
jgi:signal transduction histidine kinase